MVWKTLIEGNIGKVCRKKKNGIPLLIPIQIFYYRRGMKLALIDVGYCLLQFDTLKFFLGVRLHGWSLPNFNFFNVNPQI